MNIGSHTQVQEDRKKVTQQESIDLNLLMEIIDMEDNTIDFEEMKNLANVSSFTEYDSEKLRDESDSGVNIPVSPAGHGHYTVGVIDTQSIPSPQDYHHLHQQQQQQPDLLDHDYHLMQPAALIPTSPMLASPSASLSQPPVLIPASPSAYLTQPAALSPASPMVASPSASLSQPATLFRASPSASLSQPASPQLLTQVLLQVPSPAVFEEYVSFPTALSQQEDVSLSQQKDVSLSQQEDVSLSQQEDVALSQQEEVIVSQQQGVYETQASDAPKKRGRRRKYPEGCAAHRRREKKVKVYELGPMEDDKEEKKRQNAINAKKHRDLQKNKIQHLTEELQETRAERDSLQQEVERLRLREQQLLQMVASRQIEAVHTIPAQYLHGR